MGRGDILKTKLMNLKQTVKHKYHRLIHRQKWICELLPTWI